MEKIDLEKVYFHGIDRWKYGMSRDNELKQLDLILKSGTILSRNEQIKLYGEHEFNQKLEKYKNYTNYNGADYVSISKKFSDNSKISEAYKLFVENCISIIISPNVLKLQNEDRGLRLEEGEFQIRDKIPKEYFIGIAIDKYSLEELAEYLIKQKCSREEILQELENEDKNSLVNEIRKLLKINGYDLQVYQLSTGKQMLSLEEVLEKFNLAPPQKI